MATKQPLAGIRITDFTWAAAGPIATRFFAHFGAEVIKLESKTRVDVLRPMAPFAGGSPGYSLPMEAVVTKPNLSGYFNNFNSNKLSVQLNLSLPKGQELAKRLVKISDIVIDNFSPTVMQKWGLAYEDLVKVRPDIIVAKMPMLGAWGPHMDHIGFGRALGALAGLNHLSGMADDPPIGTGTNYPDYSSNPCHAAVILLAALRYRRKTGRGQNIEVCQYESTVNILETAILDYTINGRVQNRRGNRLPHACPHGAYPCKGEDRWCAIAVFTDAEWASLCRIMDREELIGDPQLGTMLGRLARVETVDRIVSEWTVLRPAEEVMEALQRAGVSAGGVETGEDMLDKDRHLAERKHWVYLDHPEAGRTAYHGDAFKLSLTPGDIRSAAPCLGQHTEYVCRELLGMSETELDALKEERVLE